MCADFINLTAGNLAEEHLCCIIRSRKAHPGVETKRRWLAERLKEGHVFRKLDAKATVFVEYAPLEAAWVPIVGDNYIYIYSRGQRAKRTCSHVHLATAARVKYPDACIGVFDCLWVLGDYKGKGYGKALMEYCLNDAGKMGRSGVCMLGATKQKAWLSDQSFAKKFGFETVDRTENGYELLARSFDGAVPAFSPNAKKMKIEQEELTIYYDQQCPYTYQSIESVKQYCASNHVPVSFFLVDTLQKAKELPCVFNNWAVFYKGRFETVNLLDATALKRILKK